MIKNQLSVDDELNPLYMSRIREGWRWLMTIGLSFIIIGCLAIIKSLTATIFSLYVLGFIILFSGIGYATYSLKFWWTNWMKFFLYFMLGIVYLVAGIVIIQDPVGSAFPITAFMAIFYMFVGLWRAFSAFQFKLPRAMLEMIGGIIAFILGIFIWIQWPSSSLWVIGLFVGIDIFLIGVYFTAISLFARNLLITNNSTLS